MPGHLAVGETFSRTRGSAWGPLAGRADPAWGSSRCGWWCFWRWIVMGFHRCSWVFMVSMDFHWFSWVFMDFHGFSWVFHGFPWVFHENRRVTVPLSMEDLSDSIQPRGSLQNLGCRISSSATGRWIITSSLCDPVKPGSMSPPSRHSGRAKPWGRDGH